MSRDWRLYLEDILGACRKIAGFRDVIAHGYFGLDDDVVWAVVQRKVPELRAAIGDFLERANPHDT